MSEPIRPREVPFEVDGERFVLYAGLNALAFMQADLGIGPCQDFFPALKRSVMTPFGVRALVFRALQARHPAITPEDVGALIDQIGWQRSAQLLVEALAWTVVEGSQSASSATSMGPTAGRPA